MRVLVTGGSGFIGSNLTNYFASKGNETIVYDSLSREGTKYNLDWLKRLYGEKIEFVHGDIRDFELLKQYVKDVDAIVHTAAQVAVTSSIKNPREDFEINALGTFNVLEAVRATNKDIAVIFFSTNKVYGNNVNKIPLVERETRYEFADPKYKLGIPEDFPTDANEHTPYGVSKYTADLYVRDYTSVYGLPTVTFRCSCMYGIRQFGNEDQGWVAHFVISSIFDKPLTIYGDGKQVRDVLFVEDVNRLVESALTNIRRVKGEVFNIGGGPQNTISLLELISMLERKLNKKISYSFSDWRPADQKVYISDIRKAEKLLGWKPLVKPKEGVEQLIKWVYENKELFV
jgi:CDP-paratose 2-epimerase